jgi:hypothetical protein
VDIASPPGAARTFSGASKPIAGSRCSRSASSSFGSSCGGSAAIFGGFLNGPAKLNGTSIPSRSTHKLFRGAQASGCPVQAPLGLGLKGSPATELISCRQLQALGSCHKKIPAQASLNGAPSRIYFPLPAAAAPSSEMVTSVPLPLPTILAAEPRLAAISR